MIDLRFTNHGTIWLMEPLTELGTAWIAEHIPADAPRFCESVAIESRYVESIVEGATFDGLICVNASAPRKDLQ